MELSRREFLKLSGQGAGVGAAAVMGLLPSVVLPASKQSPLKKKVKETTTICCYCSVGCGAVVTTYEDGTLSVEGDPNHPVSRGDLCPKGLAMAQIHQVDGKINPYRLTKPLYRAPNGRGWEEKTRDWMIDTIARRVKATRDKSWNATAHRTDAIASFGGGELDNEECYLLAKMDRALGMVYVEHCARLCHSSTVAGLAQTFGRGAMTNHWIDFRNADCLLIMGSNAAENHPMTFKWVEEAMARGAKLISVDPRFTRTSAKAHIYAPLRSGTDIAFLGGMIKYVLDDMEKNPGNYNMEYVLQYTNAALIVNPAYKFNDGLFGEVRDAKYTAAAKDTWQYTDTVTPATDVTLKDPNCVFQLLKKHFARYDADTVCGITGTPKGVFLQVCTTYAATGQKGKAGSILYAMGITQHTYGVQNIRAFSILQLLLGNMGIAGGGINAMRGTSNVQGSTDFGLLTENLPGYLAAPVESDVTLDAYLKRVATPMVAPQGLSGDKSLNWLGSNYRKYIVSLLKAWYGKAATKENDFGYGYLPLADAAVNCTHIGLVEAIGRGIIKGLWVWGQNPASGGPNSNAARTALANLEWLVSTDIWLNETSEFWTRPGVDPSKIGTEVFLLPVAASYEKEGSISSSSRWAQWRYKAVDPPGEAMPDLELMDLLWRRIRDLYRADTAAPGADSIINLDWNYGNVVTSDAVAREINGFDLTTGKLVEAFSALRDDGTTSSGSWIYCNMYTESEGNKAKKRSNVDTSPKQIGLYSNWAWCWPMNRRIIYNRAAVDLNGVPWDSEHPVVEYDVAGKKWVGDVIDGGGDPIGLSPKGSKTLPFIMNKEGVGRLWVYTLADGPLPEVYEPWESPLDRNLMSATKYDPSAFVGSYMNERGTPDKFPYVGTSYRCIEHWQTGIMTRNLPWLVEMAPEMYVEIGEQLAAQKGISNGDRVVVSSARGEVTAVAVVTKRFQQLTVGGKPVHHIGVIWQFGYSGMAKGDSGNLLTPSVGDANMSIPEFKTFLCNVRRT